MKIDFAARVAIGPKETNDDRVLIDAHILDMASYSGTIDVPAVAAVCDGCGGYAGGGVAAQTVLETLSAEDAVALSDVNYLTEVLAKCQQNVMAKKEELPHFSAMCTTVAGCVFCDDSIVIFHSGDSRIYRNDRWGIAKMTIDHSLVQELVDMGEITPEEALVHPQRNIIRRCIGIECPLPDVYVSRTAINPGEKYLFCSDGLWESVNDTEIKEILDSDMSLQQMADTLIEKALVQGADDNISVCICAGQGAVEIVENTEFILD